MTEFCAVHQIFTRTCPIPHQSHALGFTRRAVILKVSGSDPSTTTKQMNNNKANKGFIVKTAATYVAFAAAPFVIALGVSSVFAPPVEAKPSYPSYCDDRNHATLFCLFWRP